MALTAGASRDFPDEFVEPYINVLIAASKEDREAIRTLSLELGYLTGDESPAMLNAHTDSVLTLAKDLGIPVSEQIIPREMLYLADEVFFTGTAAELTPIRSVDKITVRDGSVGPITTMLMDEFYGIVKGKTRDRFGWFTPVKVKQPVSV